ncbi:MAG: hypothetical protein H6733_16215 [Alphaproteobacteria bacterium]|nr:hypothetical protein [Alphaproteobacteria bacterium]
MAVQPWKLPVDPGPLAALGVQEIDDLYLVRHALGSAGLWWVAPLAEDEVCNVYGVALSPDRPVATSPVVHAMLGDVAVVCSRGEHAVAATAWFARLTRSAMAWREVQEVWTDLRGPLAALERSLGGDGGVACLEEVLFDEALATLPWNRRLEPVPIRRGLEVLARVDPTAETATFCALAGAWLDDGTMPSDADVQATGIWRSTFATLATASREPAPIDRLTRWHAGTPAALGHAMWPAPDPRSYANFLCAQRFHTAWAERSGRPWTDPSLTLDTCLERAAHGDLAAAWLGLQDLSFRYVGTAELCPSDLPRAAAEIARGAGNAEVADLVSEMVEILADDPY